MSLDAHVLGVHALQAEPLALARRDWWGESGAGLYTTGLRIHVIADDLDGSYNDGETITGTVSNNGSESDMTVNGGMTYETNELNGHSAIRFNGTTGYLSVARAGAQDLNEKFIVMVARIRAGASGSPNFGPIALYTSGTDRANPVMERSLSGVASWWDNDNSWKNTTVSVTFGTYYLMAWRFDFGGSGFVDFYNAGAYVEQAAVSVDLPPYSNYYVGYGGTSFFDGDVCEAMVYDHAPLDADVTNVLDYLATKYGF